ncbi:ABC transporter ATP-binding protein [Corynebacterium crudilactis]|uniref:Cobalamin/Fe3+-siderophore ABC transporter ATP-binding protein n=1 Tax=Corynebacterium crudilactis TaxID=1652495 RepID=A0A172QRM6_9CORY|nr:ABC transporter ATP-binding protein [Corynebacterium crudilactis]ANE03345.1 cobalamin/Fe3+-siderophore ABC transporter ATP-binding protein [Corynebacterium crudilactis]
MPQRVEVRNLNVEFPTKYAVKDVSFSAPAGQVTALIGPNGAGKSTALSAIAGLVASTGQVVVGGREVVSISAKNRAQLLSLVPQNTELRIGFSARDVVAMGRYPHRGRFAVETDADRRATDDALRAINAQDIAEQPVNELSGGQQQLIHIGRALAQDTAVVLLDEPVSALDLRHQVDVLQLLRDRANTGTTVIVVLHDLNHVARWCDHAVLMANGEVVSQGPVSNVLEPSTLSRVYGLPIAVRDDPDTESLRVIPHPLS